MLLFRSQRTQPPFQRFGNMRFLLVEGIDHIDWKRDQRAVINQEQLSIFDETVYQANRAVG